MVKVEDFMVESKSIQFTKSDLQDTDIVTLKNREKCFGIDCINDTDLREDLTDMYSNSYNIIKVERPTELVTVYEREEKVKVSLDELKEYYEKNTGKKVEVE